MQFLPTFCPNLYTRELGDNWVLLSLWLRFKKTLHWLTGGSSECSQTTDFKESLLPAIKQECNVPINYKRKQ